MAIGASAEYIIQSGANARKAGLPVIHRSERRVLSSAPAVEADSARISAAAVKPQPLNLNPEAPVHDASADAFQQCASTPFVVGFLAKHSGLTALVGPAREAMQEDQLVKGAGA